MTPFEIKAAKINARLIALMAGCCLGVVLPPLALADEPETETLVYFGCLFVEAQRDNAPLAADGIATAQNKCKSEGLDYGDEVAKRAGSDNQSARHNSRKFVQGYLKKQVPAALKEAGLIE